jgi:predicted phosphate transport protein (TIGR00153 family)
VCVDPGGELPLTMNRSLGGDVLRAMRSIGQLLRGRDRDIFDLIERAGANIVRAAELLDEMLSGFPETQGLARDILNCEHAGDRLTHDVIRRLYRSVATPIDRADVLRLVSALDDIVDFIEEVADYLGLYRIEAPMLQAHALAHVLLEATRQIEMAIPLARELKDINQHTVEVHRLENEGDRIVRGAIASLFERPIDPMVVIGWKDIFERLENAIDSTKRAAYLLESIVVKTARP